MRPTDTNSLLDYFYNNEVELKIIQDEESYSYSPVCGKVVMIMMKDPSHWLVCSTEPVAAMGALCRYGGKHSMLPASVVSTVYTLGMHKPYNQLAK